MRDVIFKNLTSPNSRKKDVLLKEVFVKDGLTAKTERRSFYYIKDVMHVDKAAGLQNWINSHDDSAYNAKRHFYIFREHSDPLGEDRLLCKISGTFYAIVDNNVYTIAFLHAFRVSFVKGSIAK